jgi:hypothetical protein
MPQVYIFRSVEIFFEKPFQLPDQCSAATGAFVHCLVSGKSIKDAKARLSRKMKRDGYRMLDVEQATIFKTYADCAHVTEDMWTSVQKLRRCNGVCYLEFFCYEDPE